jgi:hypothetical protein
MPGVLEVVNLESIFARESEVDSRSSFERPAALLKAVRKRFAFIPEIFQFSDIAQWEIVFCNGAEHHATGHVGLPNKDFSKRACMEIVQAIRIGFCWA